jgi:hypothetical protein
LFFHTSRQILVLPFLYLFQLLAVIGILRHSMLYSLSAVSVVVNRVGIVLAANCLALGTPFG